MNDEQRHASRYECIGGIDGHGGCHGHYPGPDCPYCTVDGVPSPLLKPAVKRPRKEQP